MTTLRDDVRYSVRTLRKAPAFTLTAVLTIALGIGACTAIFSVVNAVLLRSLPYAEPERLVFVQTDLTARDVTDYPMAPGDLPDLREQMTTLQDAAAVITGRTVFTSDTGEPEFIVTGNVTTNFFRTLGARIARGRDFVDEDGTSPPPPPQVTGPMTGPPPATQTSPTLPPPAIVILSHGFWQRRFGGTTDVVGKTFRVGQLSAQVVGVLEPGFELLWPKAASIQTHPDVYVAMRTNFATAARGSVSLRVVGRLRPGATVAQAQQQADATVADLKQRFPVKQTAGLKWRVEPMHRYVVARVRPLLIALMGAVTFVLLIACANVANLLLVRGSERARELTVRAALGSGRWALMRQTLVESFALATTGAAFGVGLAWVGTRVLLRIGPTDLPRLEHVALDPAVFAFALAATLLSTLLFGLVPAVRASKVNVAESLRSAGRTGALAGAGRWLRHSVVVSEVALAFVLLIGCGLMVRSFITMNRAQPGFDANGVLTFLVPNQNMGMQSFEQAIAFGRQIQERLASIAGVTAVSSANSLPFDGNVGSVPWATEAALNDPDLFQQADRRTLRAGYFATMKTRVIEGREFTEADAVPDARVAIIDDVLARLAFPGTTAVGKHLLARNFQGGNDTYTVIGVVQHQRNLSPAADSRQTFFTPGFETSRWIVRTSGDPMDILQSVRNELRALNPNLIVAEVKPLHELVDGARAHTRFALWCIGVFGTIAALLAAIGLYGVLSTSVRIRTAEIGMRMALGATARNIFGIIVQQGLGLSVAGIVIGLLAAFWLTQLMTTMLVGVTPTDPATFAAIGALFLAIATAACSMPALRAARLAPLIALRDG